MADWEDGRPTGWIGQPDYCGRCDQHPASCYICTAGFEAGASAMHKALIKWLFEPCDEHPDINIADGEYIRRFIDSKPRYFIKHRKDCPKCMEQLKGE